MPTYFSPGVYVEEVPLTPSIAGVGTSTAAFVGIADVPAGDMPEDPDGKPYPLVAADEPFLVTNWEQFKRQFGDFHTANEVLAQSVYGFFNNGGGRCWVARVGSLGTAGAAAAQQAATAAKGLADAAKTAADAAKTAVDAAKTSVDAAVTAADDAAATPGDATKQTAAKAAIDKAKTDADTAKTAADGVKTAADAAKTGTVIAAADGLVELVAATVTAAAAAAAAAAAQPVDPAKQRDAAHATAAPAADAATRAAITADAAKTAADAAQTDVDNAARPDAAAAADPVAVGRVLTLFEAIDEIAIVAAPGAIDTDIRTRLVDHCARLKDRVAVLDGLRTRTITVAAIKGGVTNSDFAALYFPWIEVSDPIRGGTSHVPPSGLMAGIWARVDIERGVHKAPANVDVRGALGLEYALSTREQDGLNPEGVNAIRLLSGTFRVWGARTMGGNLNESLGGIKYLNVRRLMNFLRESIDEGTQFAVFEPNSSPLWERIKRSVEGFLTGVWRDGALFGVVPEQAFRVICDETTNPPDVRDRGQVVTEVWVAPVKPAEFVVFRINQVNEIPA